MGQAEEWKGYKTVTTKTKGGGNPLMPNPHKTFNPENLKKCEF